MGVSGLPIQNFTFLVIFSYIFLHKNNNVCVEIMSTVAKNDGEIIFSILYLMNIIKLFIIYLFYDYNILYISNNTSYTNKHLYTI